MRPLTEVEFKIMLELSDGKTRLRLACEMNISESTLNDRLSAIRAKLNAPTVKLALEAFKTVYATTE